ncbi:sterol desaturase family protein [Marinomonas dokdonensis]|uniref:sterol desaturase family protein n=1 Tax=Marinomonas dokdonensis TaxID=328224 RepID=UPI0040559716
MFEVYLGWLEEELARAFSSFFDMGKRVSFVYLISAFLTAAAIFYWRYGKQGFGRMSALLSWRVWWHPSARADYLLWIANRLLLALILPKMLSQAVWVSWLYFFWLEQGITAFSLGWPDLWVMALFTLCYFLADDFSRFFIHWCLHKNAYLWAFHQVHHSAKVLTPFTVFRTHPVEGLLFLLRSLSVQSVLISVFLLLFPQQVGLWQIFGVIVSSFVFNVLGANLRHSGVALSYGEKIERWLISPAQHQLHHSLAREHYDKNFGVILAIWDRMFGSWYKGDDNQVIQYGTGLLIDQQGWLGQWLLPIKQVVGLLKKHVRQIWQSSQQVYVKRPLLSLLCFVFV